MKESTKILILALILFVLIVIHYYMFWFVGTSAFFMLLHFTCVFVGLGVFDAALDKISKLKDKENFDKKLLEIVEIFS